MNFRQAEIKDIPQIQIVRHAVKENTLSDPALVTDADCENFIMTRGKGWVCEEDGKIVGFAIADLVEENIWALFVLPEYERIGIGKHLQEIMLDWYFGTGKEYVWLGTSPGTRAAEFYKRTGWTENGMHGSKEVKFELVAEDYRKKSFG